MKKKTHARRGGGRAKEKLGAWLGAEWSRHLRAADIRPAERPARMHSGPPATTTALAARTRTVNERSKRRGRKASERVKVQRRAPPPDVPQGFLLLLVSIGKVRSRGERKPETVRMPSDRSGNPMPRRRSSERAGCRKGRSSPLRFSTAVDVDMSSLRDEISRLSLQVLHHALWLNFD